MNPLSSLGRLDSVSTLLPDTSLLIWRTRKDGSLRLGCAPALMEHPMATAGLLVEKTGITPATFNKALSHLERLGIVREVTAQKRNRVFSYRGYVEILSRGTEPPER